MPSDPNRGRTHDPVTETRTLHGAACDQLEDGTVADIDVVVGCAAPTPD